MEYSDTVAECQNITIHAQIKISRTVPCEARNQALATVPLRTTSLPRVK